MLRDILIGNGNVARRKNSARVLTAYNHEGVFRPIANCSGNPDDPDKYEQVARALHERLQGLPKGYRFSNDGAAHGYTVTLRIIRRGVDAYAHHIAAQDRGQASVGELHELLENSYDPAVTTFISEPGDACKVLEGAFGLLKREKPRVSLPFVITSIGAKKRLTPCPAVLNDMQEEVSRLHATAQPYERCAAGGQPMRQVWAAAIGTCAINEHLFPADIAAINAGTYELPA